SRIAIRWYKGEVNDQGFIAVHDGIFFGLSPNVKTPGNYGGRPLYYWGNHKVIEYASVFWDLCYRTTYASLSEMCEYSLTGQNLCIDGSEYKDTFEQMAAGIQAER